MSQIDLTFQRLCQEILSNGKEYTNIKRGVKRLQIPSYTFRHSFEDGFPALSLKKLPFKAVVTELLWFLRGDTDLEFLHKHKVKIWDDDAYGYYKKRLPNANQMTKEEYLSDANPDKYVGLAYGYQWRSYNNEVDQIENLLKNMHKDIMSSQLIVNAWNPSDLDLVALPPCHTGFQIVGVPLGSGNFGFELHWNQRSVDTFLGLPFNIASYALLAKILERITGYKALGIEGSLKCVHFYDNQYEAAHKITTVDPDKHGNCELVIQDDIDYFDLRGLEPNMFGLLNYTSEDEIRVKMLAPK